MAQVNLTAELVAAQSSVTVTAAHGAGGQLLLVDASAYDVTVCAPVAPVRLKWRIGTSGNWSDIEGGECFTVAGPDAARVYLAKAAAQSASVVVAVTVQTVGAFMAGRADARAVTYEQSVTGGLKFSADPRDFKRNRINFVGQKLFDLTHGASLTLTGAGTAFSQSAAISKRNTCTLKVDTTNASVDPSVKWTNATGVQLDATKKLLSFEVFIPKHINPDVSGPSITITLNNTTSFGGTSWTVNSNYLRAGWNEIRLCGNDADGGMDGRRGVGTLPWGMSKSTNGTAFNFSQSLKYFNILVARNTDNPVLYFDEVRTPDTIKPFLCIGFDASGYAQDDDIFTRLTAPFFKENGIPAYTTSTWVYDGIYQGTPVDARREELYKTWGWDAILHSWDHGAGSVSTTWASGNTLVVSGSGTLATLTLNGTHNIPLGKSVPMAVFGGTGASAASALGVFMVTATTTAAVTYAITAGVDGTVGGTVKASTSLNLVTTSAAKSYLPIVLPEATIKSILRHEWWALQSYGLSKGWFYGSQVGAYPGNSIPDMAVWKDVAAEAGIRMVRGTTGTTCRISTFGVDNPLAIGSMDMGSESYGSSVQMVANALQGAIHRGEGLFLYGHGILEAPEGADISNPPGMGGNPSVTLPDPAQWWYQEQLELFFSSVAIPMRDAGQVDFVKFSDLAEEVYQSGAIF